MNKQSTISHALPDEAERELLDCLSEEASEIIKEVCKANRFGLDSWNPLIADTEHTRPLPTHRRRIAQEIGDLMAVMNLMVARGLIDPRDIAAGQKQKAERLRQY